jgi:hypothetical protein
MQWELVMNLRPEVGILNHAIAFIHLIKFWNCSLTSFNQQPLRNPRNHVHSRVRISMRTTLPSLHRDSRSGSAICHIDQLDNHRHRDTPHHRTGSAQKATSPRLARFLPAIFAFRIAPPFRLAKQRCKRPCKRRSARMNPGAAQGCPAVRDLL